MKLLIILSILLSAQPSYGLDEATLKEALSHSDDVLEFEEGFYKAAKTLIKNELCTVGDFKELGGWYRSSSKFVNGMPLYFIWCKRPSYPHERFYFNTSDKRIYECDASLCTRVQ